MKQYLLVVLLLTSSLAGCLNGSDEQSGELEAVFTFTPVENIREGQTINFDGSSSITYGSVTYKWDFEADGSVDKTGKTVTWVYATAGNYEVILSISDGIRTVSQTRPITVFVATAQPPTADTGSFSSSDNCDGDSPSEGNYYLFYICEDNKDATSSSERKISATTTADLDASDSTAAADDYIAKWEWDVNLNFDSDGDGDMKNDPDFTGETFAWTELAPGEYKIQLTVTAGGGMTDTDTTTVYVSYVGKWSEFEMAPAEGTNQTQTDPEDLDFELSVIYDTDSGNTIRKAVIELIYPQQDDDCYGNKTFCRNQLDLYGFNTSNKDSKDEDAKNTSSDDRQAGDCPDEMDCIWLSLIGYTFDENEDKDGEWKISVRNEDPRDVAVESLVIRLVYK